MYKEQKQKGNLTLIWELREGQYVWSTEREKDECKKQDWNPLSLFTSSFLTSPTSVSLSTIRGHPRPRTWSVVCAPFQRYFLSSLGLYRTIVGSSRLFHTSSANWIAKGKQKWLSSKLLPPHNRCCVSHTPSWVRNQNSCLRHMGIDNVALLSLEWFFALFSTSKKLIFQG